MKGTKAWGWLGLSLAVVVTPLLVLGVTRATPQVGTWTLGVRPVADWLRSYHDYHVRTREDGTKEVYEGRSLLALWLSRPLHGPKAQQMIAFYEKLPQRPGVHYGFTQARWFGGQSQVKEGTGMPPTRGRSIARRNHDLLLAAENGDVAAVKTLLDKGADVNVQKRISLLGAALGRERTRDNDLSPLFYATADGHAEVVELLLRRGADVNVKTRLGTTALMVAASTGDKRLVTLLLARGADVTARNKDGMTALQFASKHGGAEVAQLLKKAGARK